MSMMRGFFAHEAVTQFRSTRFRGLAIVYIILGCMPAVVVYILSRRSSYAIGSASYMEFVLYVQSLLTTLLAAALSIDAMTRERDEGSFAVLGVAPMSSAGYLLRRWLSVVAICVPVTLIPPIVAASLAAYANRRVPLFSAFAGGWLLHVVPALLITSAFALALGTITGRTVLAIIGGVVLLTAGVGFTNDLLAYAHRHVQEPPSLLDQTFRHIQQLTWAVRAYWNPQFPTEAGFAFRAEATSVIIELAIVATIAVVFIGIS